MDLADALVGPDRAQSLEYRFKCENLLSAKAVEQPIFGWGGWGAARSTSIADSPWRKAVPTDGLWIIILGTKGFVGLTLFYLAMILPAVLFVWRFPVRLWGDPRVAAGSLAAVLLVLYMVDCLMNGFPNIIYVTLAGGLVGLEPKQLRAIVAGRGGEAAGRQAAGATPRVAALGAVRPGPSSARSCWRTDTAAWDGPSSRRGAGRGGVRLAAGPRLADRPDRGRARRPELRRLWCDCANDLAWLRANHPDPARRDPEAAVAMARRMVEECPEAETYWNTLGVAYYRAGDDRLGHRRPRSRHGPRRRHGLRRRLPGHGACAAGRPGGGPARLRPRHLIRPERDYPGHPELAGFCDEAQSILADSPGTPAETR